MPARHILVLLSLPLLYLAAEIYLRGVAGPFWQWNLLDPAYFYLLDSLNLIGGLPPGHAAHPGITVDTFGAVVLTLSELGRDAAGLIDVVLDNPETYLAKLSTSYLVLNSIVLAALGYAAYWAFGAVLPAMVCQLAPFMSTIVLKHAFLPKPEAMLIAVTMVLIATATTAIRTQDTRKLAIAFGIVAGFGLATKVTAAPIFVLPLFLLSNLRMVILYGLVSVLAFGIFFLPGIGAFEEFAKWMVYVAKGSGAHGAGPQTFIDVSQYPKAVVKILKRPALKVPLILALLTLLLAVWRFRRDRALPGMELRLLLGVTATQIMHVLFVAKQPAAFYLIPSYMLSALSILLSARLLWRMKPGHWPLKVSGTAAGCIFLVVFVVAQVNGVKRLEGHFRQHNRSAMSVDNQIFEQCARIYIYAASSPVFALFLADRVTGLRHSAALARHYPGANYWVEDWYDQDKFELRNWQGRQDFKKIRDAYPCLYFRGNRRAGLITYLKRVAPNMNYETKCSAPPEMIATVNVTCQGEVTP